MSDPFIDELSAVVGFSGNPLDRLSEKRDDPAILASLAARGDARSLVFSPNLWASLLKSGENFSVPSRTGEAHTRNTGDPRQGGTRGAKTKSLRGTETTQPGVAPPTRSNFDWTNSLLKRSASRQVIELDPKYPRSCSTHNAKNFYKKLAHQHSQEARRFPMAPAGASC
jgi:hypothetical protein